jgi:peptidoglycan hydrolase CwlO-like protein
MNSLFTKKQENEVEANEVQPITVDMRDYGFRKAGQTGGDPDTMAPILEQIRNGHIISESQDTEKQQDAKDRIEKEIDDVRMEINGVETQIQNFEEIKIPTVDKQIKESKEEINDFELKKVGVDESNSESRFNFFMYLSAFIPTTIFLYGFYVSSFHNAFFRDIAKAISGATVDNIASILNTVFNGNAFQQFHLHWFAPVIFFAFAMVLHRIFDSKSKLRFLGLLAIVSFIFIADGLLAYFIEANNHQVKILMGLADGEWVFYKSPVFIMVLVMGFFTCMGWSILLHTLRSEKEKLNPKAVIRKKIFFLKEKIKELEIEINNLKSELLKQKEELKNLEIKVESLKKEKENIHYGINILKHNVHSFYSGWLQYVVNLKNSEELKDKSKEIIDNFMSSLGSHNIKLVA